MDHNNQFYKNHQQHHQHHHSSSSSTLSWGWLVVIALGLIPLVFLVLGNRRNRPQGRRRTRAQQQQAAAAAARQGDEEEDETKRKKGKYVYSGWRVIVCLDYDVDICGGGEEEDNTKSLVSALQRLASESDLHVIVQVDSDEKEQAVLNVVESKWKLFDHGMARSKVLFCETSVGRVAIARQIEPSIYIDRDETTVRELKRFIRRVGSIATASTERSVMTGLRTSGSGLAIVATDLSSLLGKLY